MYRDDKGFSAGDKRPKYPERNKRRDWRKTVPRSLVGAFREVTVPITGDPEDFLVEVQTVSWFSHMAIPRVAKIASGIAGVR